MTDNQIDQNKGLFRATASAARQYGDPKPTFRGVMTIPGDPAERPVVLWARRNKSGILVLTGHTRDPGNDALAKLETLVDGKAPASTAPMTVGTGDAALTLSPRDVVLFEASDKSGRRPHFHGYHHTGEKNQPPIAIAVWTNTDHKKQLTLSGITRVKREAQQVQQPDNDQDQDMEPMA